FFRILIQSTHQSWQPDRIGQRALEPQLKSAFILNISVMVVDLETVEPIGRPVESLFDMAEEDISSAAPDGFDILLAAARLNALDRFYRVGKEASIFGARDKQYAVAKTAPAFVDEIPLGPDMICEHDDLGADALGGRQQLGSGASGVGRV